MAKLDLASTKHILRPCDMEDQFGTTVIVKMFLRSSEDMALIAECHARDIAAAEAWFADADILSRAVERHSPGPGSGQAQQD